MAWLRLGAAVTGRRIAAVTALFKEAVLSQHQRIHGEPPAVLHGHGFGENGYEIARYLALPDVGYRWSRGRIHGLALWLPPGCDFTARRMALDAAAAIRRLTGRGVDVSVAPREDEARPRAALPDRWLRRSRGWATAFPAIHERRRALNLAEVAQWCRHAGLPDPGRLSVGADAAGHGGGRPGARGGEPSWPACTSVLSRRAPVRSTGSGTSRDRLRTAARIRTLHTSR